VSVLTGTHELGPEDATLSVRTERAGAAAKAGHDLLIRVNSWRATLILGEDDRESSVELAADAGSLEVLEGTGGVQTLGDDDKANIKQTIDDEILEGGEIEFHSTRVEAGSEPGRVRVEGELTILGRTEPIAFDLTLGENGALSATAVVKQTEWGIKPYSALFGALKVRDEVEVVLEGHL
jgi:hypothetical protein